MPLVLWCFAEQIERKRRADLGTLRTVRGGGPIRLALPVANTRTGAPTGTTFLVYSRFSFRSHAERGYLRSNRFRPLPREPERVCRDSGWHTSIAHRGNRTDLYRDERLPCFRHFR